MVDATTPDWASRQLRLDPFQLPQSASLSGLGEHTRGLSFEIDRQGASLWQANNGEVHVFKRVACGEFKGIAARTLCGENQQDIFTLELHHADPELCLPLLVAYNLDDIAADWHTWSKMMKLPMLLINAQNKAEPVRNQMGSVLVEEPADRRKRVTSPKRRPWFMRRRKTGRVCTIKPLQAAEIIARQ